MAVAAATRRGFLSALRASGAGAPFAASLIGRLPMGAIGLVFILRTHEITGSFAAGGAATAAYALSLGLVAPGLGRLIDLRGQTLVLLGAALVAGRGADQLRRAARRRGADPDHRARGAHRRRRSRRSARPCARCGRATSTRTPATSCSTASPPCSRAIYIAGPVLIVAGIGGLFSISAAALACGVFGADRDRPVRAHARVARVAPGARPRARPRGRARLAGRADPARHAGRARRRHRRHRGRRARAVRARSARPARPASCSACGASAASSAAPSRAA